MPLGFSYDRKKKEVIHPLLNWSFSGKIAVKHTYPLLCNMWMFPLDYPVKTDESPVSCNGQPNSGSAVTESSVTAFPAASETALGGGFGSRRDWRQVGQEECEMSHVSMHPTWNPWWHWGRTRTFSPSSNSPRQIGHSVAAVAAGMPRPAWYTDTGMRRRALFFSPVAAIRPVAWLPVSRLSLRLHRRAQRTIEFSPRAKINAQRRTASMITMFLSKVASFPPYGSRGLFPWDSNGGLCSTSSNSRHGRWAKGDASILFHLKGILKHRYAHS